MDDILREKLIDSISEARIKTERFLLIITKLIEECEEALSCVSGLFEEIPSDARTELERLYSLREKVLEHQRQDLELTYQLDVWINNSAKSEGYNPHGFGGSTMLKVTVDPLVELSAQCRARSDEIAFDASDIQGLSFDNEQVTSRIADVLHDFVASARRKSDCLSTFSDYLRKSAEAYQCTESAITGMTDSFFDNPKPVITPPKVDSVQFSVLTAKNVHAGEYLTVDIYMYEDEYRNVVDDAIENSDEDVKETKSGYQNVQTNSKVKVILSSNDIEIDEAEEERIWNGKYLDFGFAVLAPERFEKKQILLCATVYVNEILATRLRFVVSIKGHMRTKIDITRQDYMSAFVSYASQDRNIVAAIIQGIKKARPDMDIFFDIENLRSGEDWESTLRNEIENRDVLFLCWSTAASKSKWVDMEWRYAFSNKGPDAIEPIPIDSPDDCPPPLELIGKHFNDKMLYIIKATSSTKKLENML